MLLICSAWHEEIKELANYDLAPSFYRAETLGIGFFEAGLNLRKILEKNSSISQIVFLGTAGSYNYNLRIGDLVAVRDTNLLNSASLLGYAYVPRPYEFIRSHHQYDLPQALCLSSLEITCSPDLSQKILTHYAQQSTIIVENMELYGIARTASSYGIPWTALLGISNYTDENAHADWQKNHQTISQSLCKKAAEAISISLLRDPQLG